MLKHDVMEHFQGTANIARALGLTFTAVWKWKDVVPYHSAREIERITGGRLKVRDELYSRGRPLPVAARVAS